MTIHGSCHVSAEATSFQGLQKHWPQAALTACGPFKDNSNLSEEVHKKRVQCVTKK